MKSLPAVGRVGPALELASHVFSAILGGTARGEGCQAQPVEVICLRNRSSRCFGRIPTSPGASES